MLENMACQMSMLCQHNIKIKSNNILIDGILSNDLLMIFRFLGNHHLSHKNLIQSITTIEVGFGIQNIMIFYNLTFLFINQLLFD